MAYLLKASAVLAIFYFGYTLFLQRETFFNSNRWFLLIGQISTFLLPLIVIPIYVEVTPQPFNPLLISSPPITEQSVTEHIPIESILLWVYALGVLFFFGKFTFNMLSLLKLTRHKSPKKLADIHYIETTNTIAPFSFFNRIVYNPKTFNTDELQLILNHERVHVKQKHSIDVMLSEISCIVFWFNPLVWLYKKALQQNLEFIADNHTQSKAKSKQSYQRLLLKASVPTHQLEMANTFYNSLIKKRILMLHQSKSNTFKSWKYALVIPALALFLMSFNAEEVNISEVTFQTQNSNKKHIVTATTSVADLANIESDISNTHVVLKFSDISRNADNTIREISIKTKHKGGSKYNKRVTVKNDNHETIKPFSLMLTKNEQDILFQFSDDEATLVSKDRITFGKEATTRLGTKKIFSEEDGLGENPLYIINGKHYRAGNFPKSTYHIEKITIVNKTDGLKRYGEAGKDGVVIFEGETTSEHDKQVENLVVVITKDFKDADLEATRLKFKGADVKITFKNIKRNISNELTGIRVEYESEISKGTHYVNSDYPIKPIQLDLDLQANNLMVGGLKPFSDDDEVLILLNDKEITEAEMHQIDPSIIIETHVITDKNQLKTYGNKGKDGVIIISTGETDTKLMEIPETALILINGKESTQKDMKAIHPNSIENVNVLKPEMAKALYGKKGTHGAIIVTTKNQK